MCAICDELDRSLGKIPLDPKLDAETDVYRGIVTQHAYLIVKHELRITDSEMARRLSTNPNYATRIKQGLPRRRNFYEGLLVRLEQILVAGKVGSHAV